MSATTAFALSLRVERPTPRRRILTANKRAVLRDLLNTVKPRSKRNASK